MLYLSYSYEFKFCWAELFPLIISLDKYSGSCNSVDDLSTKICVPSETKYINVKVINMITNKN